MKAVITAYKNNMQGGMDMSGELVKRRIIRGLVLAVLAIVVNILAGSILM